MPAAVVAYVSGHGFGHAVRTAEVLRALAQLRPGTRFLVRTPVPSWFLSPLLPPQTDLAPLAADVGVVQSDSLHCDPGATLAACRRLLGAREDFIARERQVLVAAGASLVVADIPFLPFDAATAAGVPAVGLANFSWDWIYADYAGIEPGFGPVVEAIRASYGRASLLLELPFAGDLGAFPRRQRIPLVARRATMPRAQTRARLDLPAGARLLLVSFGGIGLSLPPSPEVPDGVIPLVVARGADAGRLPAAYRVVSQESLLAAGLGHADLLAACDAVLSKPGYGIVAECIANRVPFLYTSRGRFAEYPVLERAVRNHLPHRFLPRRDALAGRWRGALEEGFEPPRESRPLPCDGAARAAEVLAGCL